MRTTFIYAAAWLGMVVLGILNGVFREAVIGQRVGELAAHQLSTAVGIALFAVYIWFLTGLVRLESVRQAVGIGILWVAMTVTFEFLFGHYVAGHPWSRLLHDYNLLAGRVWSLVLVWTGAAPAIFYRIRS